ncbi:MAG: inorganic phosphate transporter [Myxacorys chilensis ATA2-1-KO14]|jgi:PiT family inorganic phosphate transporter|nr:inorganic phosphate transporter [Myxacorys chilensis ATA2-1-KO14]
MANLFLVVPCVLAFYLAWNLGANDVANSMGTSVGSKAVTFKQALIIAGILEFAGAALFGQGVSEKLATGVVDPQWFADSPQVLLLAMMAVLVAAGVWLNIATFFGFPVSSSHATVGAIAGIGFIAIGSQAVDWQAIQLISVTWIITPIVSGAIAACFYSLIKGQILDHPQSSIQFQEWIPWLSAALMSIFGVIVLPTLSQPIGGWLHHFSVELPNHDISIAIGALGAIALSFSSWRQLKTPVSSIEPLIARFQVVSACFVAFAHGSNDVGNAIAPVAAIAYIHRTGTVPLEDFEVPLWTLILGGAGIVAGLAVLGKRVITTIGEGIITLQPSGGFCAELATATTILIASRYGLPVSTSHALVGGVVGVGLVQGVDSIQFKTVRSIAFTWLITIPISAGLGIVTFTLFKLLFAN